MQLKSRVKVRVRFCETDSCSLRRWLPRSWTDARGRARGGAPSGAGMSVGLFIHPSVARGRLRRSAADVTWQRDRLFRAARARTAPLAALLALSVDSGPTLRRSLAPPGAERLSPSLSGRPDAAATHRRWRSAPQQDSAARYGQ